PMSILNYVPPLPSLIMATTHYPQLKPYTYNPQPLINPTLQFHLHTLTPTYKLLIPLPAPSNPFHISKKLPLTLNIINK
ncbi:hypothetical protein, partial [Staphylococcus epidermidis]|uniref:hypothetical protein n=1 Tax=Staphylococcus epidermidis TaxID=1282 RepID=UPI0021B3DDDC